MSFFRFLLTIFFPLFLNSSELHVRLLDPLLGIKYRSDGVTNIKEEYTTFTNTHKIFKKAGLNCSGFVLAGSRQLLGKSITIQEAKKDTNQNSDANSTLGEDWDFGRDLILNIASPFKHRFLNYAYVDRNSTNSDGIRLNDYEAWSDMFKLIKKKNIYLAAFSKEINDEIYKVLYYHVGIIIKDDHDNIWLYHATPKLGVHRIWLNYDRKMTPFLKEYPKESSYNKKILILELDL